MTTIVKAEYDAEDAMIPAEASGLTWNDTYYTDNQIEGVIAVFDVDYEKIRRSMWRMVMFFVSILVSFFFTGIFLFHFTYRSIFFAFFWLAYFVFLIAAVVLPVRTLSKTVVGLHVAVTKEGIRKDMHNYPTSSMFRTTTIIPYNEIKAIKAQRWCGCCGSTGNVLIQSSEGGNTWNLIQGLTVNSDAFISLVNAMIARNAVSKIEDVENQTASRVV